MAVKHSQSTKKRRHNDGDDDDDPTTSEEKPGETKEPKRQKQNRDKSSKIQIMADLLSKIPTHDDDGIPYSKIQLRRMKRRVKHGLHPIPTEDEEREIQQRKEEEKREVDELLFADGSNNDADPREGGETEEEEADSDEDEDEEGHTMESSGSDAKITKSTQKDMQRSKEKKRTKPVPSDYICLACRNKPPDGGEFTPHWIYDCPSKITKRGCNTKSKKLRGLHDPPSRKVFVSGLPFDVTERGVKKYFEKEDGGEVVHVKLLKFEDSQRCKGQGILTFDSDEGAKMALNLNGALWGEEEGGGKKKNKKAEKKDMKELRLKVSEVLNRFVTKKKKRPNGK